MKWNNLDCFTVQLFQDMTILFHILNYVAEGISTPYVELVVFYEYGMR